MSGPIYLGFIVEQWSADALEPVKCALPSVIRSAGLGDDEPRCFELHVHAHEGAAYLSLENLCSSYDGTGEGDVVAKAIATAAASPVWCYEYLDSASFHVAATRYTPEGGSGRTVAVNEETKVPPELESEPDFDFVRFAQDRVAAAIQQYVRWDLELLRTPEGEGPAIRWEVPPDEHALEPYFTDEEDDEDDDDDSPPAGGRAPQRAPRPERDADLERALYRLDDDAARVTRALDAIIEVLEAEEPDVDRYLARTRDDRVNAAFHPALETLRTIAEALASRRLDDVPLPLSQKAQKRLAHQQSVRGAPTTRDELVGRLKAARDGFTRDNMGALEHAVRSGNMGPEERALLAGQVKLVRLVLHIAHLGLLEGEDILGDLPA